MLVSTLLLVSLCLSSVGRSHAQSIGDEIGRVGASFFQTNSDLEASGLTTVPDGSHLVGVSDNGKIFFLNLATDTGHCVFDFTTVLQGAVSDKWNLEGVAIDPTTWSSSAKSAYVVHEGSSGDEPYLHYITYTYDPTDPNSCVDTPVEVVASYNLYGSIPCLGGSNGIESLALKSPSTGTDKAVFFVGLQDTGTVYEITSDGQSNPGATCYDGGLFVDGISGSFYDDTTGYLWSVYDNQNGMAVVDVARDCSLSSYATRSKQEEGLAIDFASNRMYIASDEGSNERPSFVAIHEWDFALSSTDCCGDGVCGGSETCNSCPTDCAGITGGKPSRRYCCEGPSNSCNGAGCNPDPCTGAGLPKVVCSFDVCGDGGGGNNGGGGCTLDCSSCSGSCSSCSGSDKTTCQACEPDVCTWVPKKGGSCDPAQSC